MDLSTVSGSLRFVGEDRVHGDTVWRTAGKEQPTAPCWRMNNTVQFILGECSQRTLFSAENSVLCWQDEDYQESRAGSNSPRKAGSP